VTEYNKLLLENGDALLQEDGSYVLISQLNSGAQIYTLTGNGVNIKKDLNLITSTELFTLIGSDADFKVIIGEKVITETGIFTLTGNNINIGLHLTRDVATGIFSLSGNAIEYVKQKIITLQTGSFNLTGNNVNFKKGKILSLQTGSFALTGNNISIVTQFYLNTKGTTQFAIGDILRIKDGVNDEWMEVTEVMSISRYKVTRDLSGAYAANTNPEWKKGATIVNYGQSGDGGVYMTSSDTNAPYLSIFTHAGAPWTTQTQRVRLGNLTGLNNPMTGGALTGYGLWTDNVYLTGVIVANSGKIGSVDNYWSIGSTGLTAVSTNSDVIINYGKTDFGQNSTNGFILGYDYSTSKPKFEIGSGTTKLLTYDGTDFSLKGGTIIGGILKTSDSATPDVQIDTTDGITIYGESLWLGIAASASVVIDSYSEINYGASLPMYNGTSVYRGQAFTANYQQLDLCKFYLKKTGAPTGNVTASIYLMSGTYGTTGIPTGSALATSNAVDISTITTDFSLITFLFTGVNKITLLGYNAYVVVVNYAGGDGSTNYLEVGIDSSSPTHGGTSVRSTDGSSWNYSTGTTLIFYVNSTAYGTETGRLSSSSTSGVRLTNSNKIGESSNYGIQIDANNSKVEMMGGSVYFESANSSIFVERNITLDPQDYLYINGTLKLRPLNSTTPVAEEGNIYFDTANKHFYGYNGTNWKQLDN